jgi:hypothetical protein
VPVSVRFAAVRPGSQVAHQVHPRDAAGRSFAWASLPVDIPRPFAPLSTSRRTLVPVIRVVLPYQHPQLCQRPHRRGYLLHDLVRGRPEGADGPDDEVVLSQSPALQFAGLGLGYPVRRK